MRKRNIIIVSLILLVFMLGFDDVFAGQKCIYENENTDELEITIYSNESASVSYNDTAVDFNFIFENDNKCPIVIWVDSSNGWDMYDHLPINIKEANLDKFESVYYNDFNKVMCGGITDIPEKIPELTSYAVTIVQVAVPIILVIMGSIDLFKGITAQKEDEIKKGQKIFIKRLIIGALIFFIVVIVKFLISLVAEASSANIVECIDCFLSGVSNCK